MNELSAIRARLVRLARDDNPDASAAHTEVAADAWLRSRNAPMQRPLTLAAAESMLVDRRDQHIRAAKAALRTKLVEERRSARARAEAEIDAARGAEPDGLDRVAADGWRNARAAEISTRFQQLIPGPVSSGAAVDLEPEIERRAIDTVRRQRPWLFDSPPPDRAAPRSAPSSVRSSTSPRSLTPDQISERNAALALARSWYAEEHLPGVPPEVAERIARDLDETKLGRQFVAFLRSPRIAAARAQYLAQQAAAAAKPAKRPSARRGSR